MRRTAPTSRLAMLGSVTVAACLAIAGCIGIPPKSAPPALRAAAPLSLAPEEATGSSPAPEWWRRYQDPDLDALIERALRRSPSVEAAQARFASAQASVRTAAALLGVQVSVDGDISTQRLSDTGLFPPKLLGFDWYDQTDLGLNVRYSFDWWGKQRSQINAALDAAHAATAERNGAALVLSTSVAQTYFAWQADTARLTLAQQRLENLQRQHALAAARVGAKLARIDESLQIEGSVAQASEQATALANSAALRRVALAALLAVSPDELPALQARALPALQAQLPANAGLDLLARRPDIVASRWRLEAAGHGVEVARAGYLPDVSLQALAGLSTIHPLKLFDFGSAAPEIGAAVHLPLFDPAGCAAPTKAALRSCAPSRPTTIPWSAGARGRHPGPDACRSAPTSSRARAGARPGRGTAPHRRRPRRCRDYRCAPRS